MTALFVSHCSVDATLVEQVTLRLRAFGFGAIFLDSDPNQGIPAGSRWERELYSALRRSDGVVFVATEASASSRWCFAELALARSLGTPIFVLNAGVNRDLGILGDVQWVDLADGESAYLRLLDGMRRIGLDPSDSFSWNPTRSPYPGLKAFSAEDAAVFFGRTPEIHRLTQLVHPTLARGGGRWVSIIGPSGSGKSSLLHAGLLPGIARLSEDWVIVPPFVPGVRPTRHLAHSLSRAFADLGHDESAAELERRLTPNAAGSTALVEMAQQLSEGNGSTAKHVLIAIDQAEELLTRTGRAEQQSFLRLLSGALRDESPLWVVCTLRSEFLSTAPERAGLTEVTDDSLVVEPLSRARLSEVIAQPARRAGLDFDPGLVERMVEETTGGDALPLLAYTLRELTKNAGPESRIRLEDYEALGGVIGALNLRADQLVRELSARGFGAFIIPTLLKLVSVDPDGEPIRRRLPRRALTEQEKQVVDAFVEARLLISSRREDAGGDAIVEVAHEALLRQWPPLREAVDQSRASIRMRSELEREAADWDQRGKQESYLLRGGRLVAIEEWVQQNETDLNPLEKGFLQASRELASREIQSVRRSNRRLRQLLAGVAALLVVAVASGVYAVRQSHQATLLAQLALARQLMTEAATIRTNQPDLALLLNVEALQRAPVVLQQDAQVALRQALDRPFHIATHQLVLPAVVNAIAYSPDGSTLATASNDGLIRLFDTATGQPRGSPLVGHTAGVHGVTFSPDGSLLASASNDGTVRLWDVATGQPRGEPLTRDSAPVGDVAFSPDGSLLAASSENGMLRLWTVSTGRQRGGPLIQREGPLWRVAFSPDGSKVGVAGTDGLIELCDVATGRALPLAFKGHAGWVNGLAFSPDTKTLASAGVDGTVRTWSVATGLQTGKVSGGNHGELNSVSYSPDGTMLAAAGRDSSVRLWDARSLRQLGGALAGHSNSVRDLAFSPDSKTLASSSYDDTVRLWQVKTTEPDGGPLTGHVGRVNDVAFNAGGTLLASAGADGTTRVWDLARHRERRAGGGGLPGGGDQVGTTAWVDGVAFSPDSSLLATATADNSARLWEASSGRPRSRPLVGHTGEVSSVAFNQDGSLLATASRDGSVRLWEVATGEPHGPPIGAGHGQLVQVAFSPDGKTLATAGEDGTIRRWDAATGVERQPELVGHTGWVLGLAYSPDGKLIASGGGDATVRLWDAASGRQLKLLTGHTDEVFSVAFRSDGRLLASSGKDGKIRIWEVASGRLIGEPLDARTREVTTVAFSPDGSRLARAGVDGTVRLLDFDAARSLKQACHIASRNLTQPEWDTFVGQSLPYRKTCAGF